MRTKMELKTKLDAIHSQLMLEDTGKELLLFPSEMQKYQERQKTRREYYLRILKEFKLN